jgi:FHS family glucose/mannose:H+ symporter-like MFS transporter
MENYNKTLAFVAACIGMSFFGISMLTLGSVLPSLTTKLMLTTLQASALVTFLPIGILVGTLLFGPIVDRFGHKILFLSSCIILLAGLIGISYFKDIPLLQLSIFVIGLGGGILNGETNALVADIYSNEDTGSKLSLLGAFYGFGAIGIPVLMGFLSKYCSFESIIRYIGIVMLICIIFCFFIRFPQPKVLQSFPVKQAVKLLSKKSLLLLSFILFFESGIEGASSNWTTLYLTKETTIDSALIVQVLTCMVVALTIARLLLAVLLKKLNQNVILTICMILAFIGFVILSLAPNFLVAAIAMAFVGVGTAATFPVILDIVGKEFNALIGTAFGVAMTIAIIGNTLINNLTGILSNSWGISVYPFIMMLAVVLMFILFRIQLLTSKQ